MTPEQAPGCPICGKPAVPESKPFCSERCRDVDLNRWLVGRYRIETDEAPQGETRDASHQDD